LILSQMINDRYQHQYYLQQPTEEKTNENMSLQIKNKNNLLKVQWHQKVYQK